MSARPRHRRPLLAAHSWSFSHLDLGAACRHAAALGYEGLDLGSGDLGVPAGLDVPAVVADDGFSSRASLAADAAGIVYTDYFAVLPHAVNVTDAGNTAENGSVFRQLVPRLVAAGVPGVTFSPGLYADRDWAEAFASAAAALLDLVAIGGAELRVSIEPHVESVTDTPERTLDLLGLVPGLTLTLDYSHFVVAGFDQEAIEPLTPFAGHLHVRQARPGELAVEVKRGTIDVQRLIERLVAGGYGGALTVEYVSHPWHGQDRLDAAAENAAMLAQVRTILDGIDWASEEVRP
jgi:sugar phosphate isomerase/epimerase